MDQDPPVVCFGAGTLIETSVGPVAVENLMVGDKAMTMDARAHDTRGIAIRKIGKKQLEANPKLYPIRIKAGPFNVNIPEQDLIVSGQHRILIRSSAAGQLFGTPDVLVQACKLVGLDGIEIATDLEEVVYYHLLLDEHQIIRERLINVFGCADIAA